MRSHLSLLSTLALLTFTAIGCTGVDSTDDANETVGQAELRIDSGREQTSDGTSQQTPTTAVDKIGFGATETPDTGATTDNTDDGPAMAGADKGDGATDQAAAAPPQIDGVALSMDDGALTISIDAFDPSGLPMSISYSGFVVGSANGVTGFTVSALDIALAAAADATPEIDIVIEDAAGEQADTAISLDVAALVEGSLGDSGPDAPASATKGAP